MGQLSTVISDKANAMATDIAPATPNSFQRAFKAVARFMHSSPIGAVAALLWIVLILIAIFAPFLAPYNPQELTMKE